MIKSMTGYGKSTQVIDGREITVELRSVNHRYLEINTRTPRAYGFLDNALKKFLGGYISRGKIDVNVYILNLNDTQVKVKVNESVANEYVNALRLYGKIGDVPDDLSLSAVSRFSDVFTVHRELEDEDVILSAVKTVAEAAVEKFSAMRQVEGEQMYSDLMGRIADIRDMVAEVTLRSPVRVAEYRERLTAKIKEVLENTQLDEQRILTEVAIFSDKVAVDEETVRLASHLKQFESIIDGSGGVGRKLDFLVQEINREVNTIGSKGNDVQTANVVVNMKAEIEKIREQIQNIE